MTRERSRSGWVARRALAVVATVLMGAVGVVAGPPTSSTAASAQVGGGTARSVTVGGEHSCVVTTTGGAKCWGSNLAGQLGDGTATDRRRPVDVVGLSSGVTQVSAGRTTTCAVTTRGGVKCWGDGIYGQLGNGSFSFSTVPVDVVGLTTGVASVSVGAFDVCALTTAGAVKCWGYGNYGLGDGSTTSSSIPVDVVGLGSAVRAVAVGNLVACALTATGVSCWGNNLAGMLGIGNLPSQPTPTAVLGLGADVTSISVGDSAVCATTGSGRMLCWGYNNGWLGVGSPARFIRRPMQVIGISGASSAVGRDFGACAVSQRHAWCWGVNTGPLGDGTTTPTPVTDLPGAVTSLSAGALHACAVNAAGHAFCWGVNVNGQLGDGTTNRSTTPVRVLGLTG